MVAEKFETRLILEAEYEGLKSKHIEINIPPTERIIHFDVLAGEIDLKCEAIGFQLLRVNSEAFRSSKNITTKVSIQGCDVAGLDFLFLRGFKKMNNLYLYLDSNVHLAEWSTLPPLSELNNISIKFSTGLNEWTEFPNLGMVSDLSMAFNLQGNKIDDVAIDRILNWILESSSAIKHWQLDLSINSLTDIPKQMSSLKGITKLDFSYNPMDGICIRSGSIHFSQKIDLIFQSAGVRAFEPGAIVGKMPKKPSE